jgi:hypothetical protein
MPFASAASIASRQDAKLAQIVHVLFTFDDCDGPPVGKIFHEFGKTIRDLANTLDRPFPCTIWLRAPL